MSATVLLAEEGQYELNIEKKTQEKDVLWDKCEPFMVKYTLV